jgi:serpin B
LEIANSVWIADDFSVKCSYKRNLKRYYKVTPYRVDMSSPDTKDLINQWCSDATEGLIDEIIESTDPSILMVIINALYFKGDWKTPFEREASREDVFYGVGRESIVKYMNNYTEVPYFACEEYKMIELPYANSDYVMRLVLPEEGIAIDEFVKGFNVEKYNSAAESLRQRKTYVTIPTIDCEFEINLNQVLMNMGMVLPFTSAADLSRIGNGSMFVSSVIQKCALKVSEEGSEAAAVTAITVMKTSLSPETPPRFIANRPYLMYITEKSTGTILFMGVKRD